MLRGHIIKCFGSLQGESKKEILIFVCILYSSNVKCRKWWNVMKCISGHFVLGYNHRSFKYEEIWRDMAK